MVFLMEFKPFENPWIKKIRLLTSLLVCSVALNVGLFTSVVYSSITKKKASNDAPRQVSYKMTSTNAKVLNRFFLFKFEELLAELDNKVLVQDGYTYRDLSLACLVNYHYFDLERAISKPFLQKRSLTFIHQDGGETFELIGFPGLDDNDFQRIIAFAKRQAWPLTAEGIFLELKKGESQNIDSLTEAFCTTSEFYNLFALFNRGEEKISQERLLPMLLEAPWHLIDAFYKAQKSAPDISKDVMRQLLREYIQLESHHAASIWIAIDSEYVLRQLNDEDLLKLITLIHENTPASLLLLKKVLCSVRSDSIRKAAGVKLYAFSGISMPEIYEHELALKTFIPSFFASEKRVQESLPPAKEELFHLVKNGDSLWKIAHKYNVSMEKLRTVNELKTDILRPGQELLIPTN